MKKIQTRSLLTALTLSVAVVAYMQERPTLAQDTRAHAEAHEHEDEDHDHEHEHEHEDADHDHEHEHEDADHDHEHEHSHDHGHSHDEMDEEHAKFHAELEAKQRAEAERRARADEQAVEMLTLSDDTLVSLFRAIENSPALEEFYQLLETASAPKREALASRVLESDTRALSDSTYATFLLILTESQLTTAKESCDDTTIADVEREIERALELRPSAWQVHYVAAKALASYPRGYVPEGSGSRVFTLRDRKLAYRRFMRLKANQKPDTPLFTEEPTEEREGILDSRARDMALRQQLLLETYPQAFKALSEPVNGRVDAREYMKALASCFFHNAPKDFALKTDVNAPIPEREDPAKATPRTLAIGNYVGKLDYPCPASFEAAKNDGERYVFLTTLAGGTQKDEQSEK